MPGVLLSTLFYFGFPVLSLLSSLTWALSMPSPEERGAESRRSASILDSWTSQSPRSSDRLVDRIELIGGLNDDKVRRELESGRLAHRWSAPGDRTIWRIRSVLASGQL